MASRTPDADGAFLLGALDDISTYVDCLRELADA